MTAIDPLTIWNATAVAAATATLPPADDRLYGPDRFAAGWLVTAVLALVAALCGLGWVLWPARRLRIRPEVEHVVGLRDRYLLHLADLERQVTDDVVSPRELHHELSRTLRRFATELGTVRASSMSAGALAAAGHLALAAAVRRYEHPQFEERPQGDPLTAIGVARSVIADAPETASGRTPAVS